jgi:hypothetical protein
MPRSSRVPLGYGHFFRPPGEVSLFCPGAHLPEGVRSGLPFPGPSFIAAKATPDTDMLKAITTAAISNVMRFRIFSHPLSLIVLDIIGPRRDARWAEAQARAPPLSLCEGVGLSH